jgi:hypothetical protein
MDYTKLFTDVAVASPIAGVLFFILRIVWNYFQKKDEAFTAYMKEQNAIALQTQRDNIMAQTNAAEASRLLATTIDQLRQHLCDSNEEVLREVRNLAKSTKMNGSRRPLKSGEKSATA